MADAYEDLYPEGFDPAMAEADEKLYPEGEVARTMGRLCYDFVHTVQLNDYVVAKRGRTLMLGVGLIGSDYFYRRDFKYPHARRVIWLRQEKQRLLNGLKFPNLPFAEFSLNAALVQTVRDYLGAETPQVVGDRPLPEPIKDPVNPIARLIVTPETVTLALDGETFTGPNRIKRTALLEAGDAHPEEYGRRLFRGVLHNTPAAESSPSSDLLSGYRRALERTKRNLQLVIDIPAEHPDLQELRWETLFHPDDTQPVTVDGRSTLFRFVTDRAAPPLEVSALKVLVAICNPSNLGDPNNRLLAGLAPLRPEQEREIVSRGLERLRTASLAEYRVLGAGPGDPVTLEALREELQRGYHVLHLIGHGLMVEGEYHLVLADHRREADFIPGPELRGLITHNLRVVLLSACLSGVRDRSPGRLALGERLVRFGVPAVVAMQDAVSFQTAQLFAQHFYDDLARTGRIDKAMNDARLAIWQYQRNPRLYDWWVPALFLSDTKGELFNPSPWAAQVPKLERADVVPPDPSQEAANRVDRSRRLAAEAIRLALDSDTVGQLRTIVLAGHTEPQNNASHDLWQDRVAIAHRLRVPVAMKPNELRAWVERANGTGFRGPSELYAQMCAVLNAGKHLMLTGPPGTGKTTLATEAAEFAVRNQWAVGVTATTASADWSSFETVGGPVPTDRQALRFRPGVFLESIRSANWLVIDEINRAEIDKAFGELFAVLAGQSVTLPHLVNGRPVCVHGKAADPARWAEDQGASGADLVVHPNWRVIGTMNVYDRALLFPMSFAFMRRFAFVDVAVPTPVPYGELRDRWVHDCVASPHRLDAENLAGLQERLEKLLAASGVLMGLREIGPAITKDLIAYVGERFVKDGPGATELTALLAEAVALYLVPQLDGLDHAGADCLNTFLKESLTPGADNAAAVRLRSLYPSCFS
jgi:MoxR-like ATPase